jgi:hypothetical protein
MNGQINFGNQPQFFISIDWVLPATLATDQERDVIHSDECHSSTKAIIPAKKNGNRVIGH